jgi:hypothetical protein
MRVRTTRNMPIRILEGGSELLTDRAVALERTEARSKEELEKRKGSREWAWAWASGSPRHGSVPRIRLPRRSSPSLLYCKLKSCFNKPSTPPFSLIAPP